jgi:hypothetical protein
MVGDLKLQLQATLRILKLGTIFILCWLFGYNLSCWFRLFVNVFVSCLCL